MFSLKQLNADVRRLMLEEAQRDNFQASEYYSKRLTEQGILDWPDLLRAAIEHGTPESLADALRAGGRLKSHEERHTKNGIVRAAVPVNAADILAQGEFNRYYIRGVCLWAMARSMPEVVVYRARYSEHPRPESEAAIGKRVPAQALLEDLRANPGVPTNLGIPLVNSGLSVMIADA